MSDDERAQFAVILFTTIVACLFVLRYIAHVAGTPTAIAAAAGASVVWRVVKMRTGVSA